MPKSVMMNKERYERLEKHFKSNLARYIKEHPGKYILLEEGTPVKESFFRTKLFGLDRAISLIEKEHSIYTFYCDRIPSRMSKKDEDLGTMGELASWYP
jgi:hypothetical protein